MNKTYFVILGIIALALLAAIAFVALSPQPKPRAGQPSDSQYNLTH